MSDLVGNPEDRFSRVTAHLKNTNLHRCNKSNNSAKVLVYTVIIYIYVIIYKPSTTCRNIEEKCTYDMFHGYSCFENDDLSSGNLPLKGLSMSTVVCIADHPDMTVAVVLDV